MKGILKGIGFFALYFGLTICFQMLLSMVFMGFGAFLGLRDENALIYFANNNILGMTMLSGVLVVTVLFFIFKARKADIKKEWKLCRFQIKEMVLPIIVAFSYSFIYALMIYDIELDNSVMIQNSVTYYSGVCRGLGLVFMIINLLIIAPVSEEIALRGIVYTRVEKTTNAAAAIMISSLLFGVMHIAAGGIVLVIGAMFMGAVFGLIFYKTDSLFICFIAHSAANLPDFILSGHSAFSNGVIMVLKCVFGLVFIIGMILMLKKREK
ncbi:MAG: CPBP family intramembrane metalloprotease [Lachnospiraceae bacterium]|nr:CPBP family intramembrane metalloprotease [Lachnospiraceae bacterium]